MRRHQPRRVLTIPNQPLVVGVVDVMEELVKFTLRTRDVAHYLAVRNSERKGSAEALANQVTFVRLTRQIGRCEQLTTLVTKWQHPSPACD